MNWSSFWRAGVLLAVSMFAAGCWGGDGPPVAKRVAGTVPVKGVLLHDGKPLADYRITFHGAGGVAIGRTGEKGEFSLGTNLPEDGAQPGEYTVAVNYVGPKNDSPDEGMLVFTIPGTPPIKLKPDYSDPRKSGLKVTVPAGGSTDLRVEAP